MYHPADDLEDYFAVGMVATFVLALAGFLVLIAYEALSDYTIAEIIATVVVSLVVLCALVVGVFVLGYVIVVAIEGYAHWRGER